MLHDRIRIGSLLAVGTLLVIGGWADHPDEVASRRSLPSAEWSTPGCEFSREPESVAVGDISMPATPAALDAAIARIEQGGQGEFATSYAGVEVDEQRVRAIVYRVPSDSFDAFIRRTAEDTCIVVRNAEHSSTDLAVWHDRVLADLPFWTDRRIRITTIGARHDGAGLEIGTQDLDRARLELPARYGSRAPLVFIQQGPVRPLATG
jgi:hypothetical protein